MAAGGGGSNQDDFSTRLAKYVPIEIAGPFPIIDKALAQAPKDTLPISLTTLVWTVFVILFLLNIGYLVRKARQQYPDSALRQTALWYQLPFSCGAFLVWTYAIDSTIWHQWYSPLFAAIFSGLFAVAAGLITPSEPPASPPLPKPGS
jgi:hypothetical protein